MTVEFECRTHVPVTVGDERFTIVGSSGQPEAQTRYDDYAPWTGGLRLVADTGLTSTIRCTSGFTWQVWSNLELRGSTAEHCNYLGGVSTFYNYGEYVGTRLGSDLAIDTMLIRSSPLSQFSASVFVGNYATSDIRSVTGADATPTIGEPVALSGGVSGLDIGWVNAVGQATIGEGGIFLYPFVRTNYQECAEGDSGGPWLTTTATGDAIAHGQQYGHILVNGVKNCFYFHVQDISFAMSATLATR
ncbi:hypothetical protein [Agromyces sp. Marseille-P2726]|uniref:hypothetical protein n=1 Tax=Agromyces sp. Marseille-P2726 TaxID=2709132 RepID=UPI00156ED36C|nr:hypothetical protein [Agromyces sp. Marseille-P2726]